MTVRRHKRLRRTRVRHRYDTAEAPLRFRNVGRATQDCLERMGIVTRAALRSALERYGAEGLVERMAQRGYTPPKHEKWRLLGAARDKDWKVLLKELRTEAPKQRRLQKRRKS